MRSNVDPYASQILNSQIGASMRPLIAVPEPSATCLQVRRRPARLKSEPVEPRRLSEPNPSGRSDIAYDMI